MLQTWHAQLDSKTDGQPNSQSGLPLFLGCRVEWIHAETAGMAFFYLLRLCARLRRVPGPPDKVTVVVFECSRLVSYLRNTATEFIGGI